MRKGCFVLITTGITFLFLVAPAMAKNLTIDGEDCLTIGNWNGGTKTCTLTSDVHERIQVDSGITLEGNGHSVIGKGIGYGIYIFNETDVTVRNVRVENFEYGIGVIQSTAIVTGNVLKKNGTGIYLPHSVGSVVSKNDISSNVSNGITLYYSDGNNISENIIEKNNTGIYQIYRGSHNSFENNEVSGNFTGGMILLDGDSSYNKLLGNSVDSNGIYGIYLNGNNYTLSGNSMRGNGYNLLMRWIWGLNTNDVDVTNTVEGKKVYYIKNAVGEVFGDTDEIGQFFCINCKDVTLRKVTLSGNNSEIFFYKTTGSMIESVKSPDRSLTLYFYDSPSNTVKNNDFFESHLYGVSKNNVIYNNNFWNQVDPTRQSSGSTGNVFNLPLPVGGNYWKKNERACVDSNKDGFCDSSFYAYPTRDLYPLAKEITFGKPACEENCYSSVMFLPGHQASRLYKKDSDGDDNQLWEPNRNKDVEQLYLNPESGASEDLNIYVGDIVDEAFGFGGNVYKKFMESMDEFVQDGAINEWRVFPYDWRMPLEDVVDDGTKLEDGSTAKVIDQIFKMAENSKTGKVTLIGHSNGGLLAKVIVDRLEKLGRAYLVDKLIMVGTPQVGTPKALAGLLHGDEMSLAKGLLLDKETARELGENMVSAYNLLPSRKYFEIVQSPVIEFDYDVRDVYDFRSIYGESISGFGSFKSFLLGDNGEREEPKEGDLDSPNVLKNSLLSRSIDTHDNLLDTWRPPEGMEVIQIAGWGLDTISGIRYDDCDIIFCPDNLSNLDRELILTEDGDGTVVVPSAVAMDGVERYYLNIEDYNDELLYLRKNREHADILEIENVQKFIKNIIQNNKTLVEHIYKDKPEVKSEDKRLRYRLHSPVSLHLYDEHENHTGLIENDDSDSDMRFYEEQIPNSYYLEFGEAKYAGSDGGVPQKALLVGEDLGTFTFEIDEIFGDGRIKNTTFENIPVLQGMRAEIAVSDSVGKMEIDIDGDGQVDAEIESGEDSGKVISLEILEKIIRQLQIHETTKNRLVNKIENTRKQMEKGHEKSADAMLENIRHDIFVFSSDNTPEKFRISEDVAKKMFFIIERINIIK